MGINLGDIIVEDSDIFGDGVNIAARLEALAEPGGMGTTRKRIRISRRFRRSLDYAPTSGRPMRLGLPAGHRRPTNPI